MKGGMIACYQQAPHQTQEAFKGQVMMLRMLLIGSITGPASVWALHLDLKQNAKVPPHNFENAENFSHNT